MAFSLNKIMLIGNIGKQPEYRTTTTNVEVCNFSLATTHSYKGKDNNWVNETTWHNIVAFNLSDFLKSKLLSGEKIFLEGRLTNRSYEDKQGVKRYVTEIIADTVSIIPLGKEVANSQNDGFLDKQPDEWQEPEEENTLPF